MAATRWFVTLFLLDMWERFSFYGMLAILFLYAVADGSSGGLGLSTGDAGALVGTYIAAAFVAAMPGAWLGDRLFGTRRAVLIGALIIAAGHTCLALPSTATVYIGLVLVAAGTGLLKPNLTALLGSGYAKDAGARRESAFSIFYMSIQISAIVAPIVTGYLGQRVNWHLGFSVAAIGMLLGVVCFLVGLRGVGTLGTAAAHAADQPTRRRMARRALITAGLVGAVLLVDAGTGRIAVAHVLAIVGLASLVVPVLAFRWLLRSPLTEPHERLRVRGYIGVFLASALFWMLFSQATTVLSLFARDHTHREFAGFSVPASWFQSLHPLFVLIGAPIAAWAWLHLPGRPGPMAKFATGLAFAGLSYLVMSVAAMPGDRVSWGWLVAAYLLQSVGELVLAPAGLNLTATVAPRAYTSQMMGIWWLSAALGAGIGAQLARLATVLPLALYFLIFGLVPLAAAAVLATLRQRLDRPLTGLAPVGGPVFVPAVAVAADR